MTMMFCNLLHKIIHWERQRFGPNMFLSVAGAVVTGLNVYELPKACCVSVSFAYGYLLSAIDLFGLAEGKCWSRKVC
jgi:hypothetical protein